MKVSIFLAIKDSQEVETLKTLINSSGDFEIIGVAQTGDACLEKLADHPHLNILFIDLFLPVYDGYYVIDQLKKQAMVIDVIVVSAAVFNEQMIRQIYSSNNLEILLKPYDSSSLMHLLDRVKKYGAQVIHESTQEAALYEMKLGFSSDEESLEAKIHKLLMKLGIPPHLKGYNYLKMAIEMAYIDPSFIGSITKVIYPDISAAYGVKSASIEACIRNVIQRSWKRSKHHYDQILNNGNDQCAECCPTNSQFIASFVTKIKLEEKEKVLNKIRESYK
jgi:two-component system response regulator (stage 0 sporulation protein A)